jgi:amino acid adenylation domain-containing protein
MAFTHDCLPLDFGGPVDREFEPFPASALESSVTERFEAIARRFSDHLAVQDMASALTYRELADLADRIAAATSGAANRAGPVAILLDRVCAMAGAIFGVLAAGRAYLPLDADQPIERNASIAAQAGVAALISAGDLADSALDVFPEHVPTIDLEQLTNHPDSNPAARPGPDDIAYIIYTSGSTGMPKGVYQNHRGLLHVIMQYTNTMHLNNDDRLSLVYSPNVTASVHDIYGALLNGASLHIVPPRDRTPIDLAQEIRARGITLFHSVPTLFRRIAETMGPNDRFDSIRIVCLGGDRVTWNDVDCFRRVCSAGAHLFTSLAMTECTRHTHWFVDDSLRTTCRQPPVGRSIPDRVVIVADDDGKPLPNGETGEVIVSSRYNALGYWNAPELTGQSFLVDPSDPKSRMFRTGDLARRRTDGLLEFVGRKDQRIKLHGHRIEPAEIESALLHLPEIAEAAVLVRNDENGTARAVAAYVKCQVNVKNLLPRHLGAMLARRLPAHMIPWPIFVVDEFPRLPNFKIDRARLARADAERAHDRSRLNDNPVIAEVIRVFEQTLSVDGASPDDNLASLGGDSLQVVEIACELARHFKVVVTLEAVQSARTIEDIAVWISSQRQQSENPDGEPRALELPAR